MGDVKDFAFGLFKLFKGQGGLAAACAAEYDQRRWLSVNGLLGIIKRDRLVEQVNDRMLRMKVAQRLRLLDGLIGIGVWNFAFVDCRTAQES